MRAWRQVREVVSQLDHGGFPGEELRTKNRMAVMYLAVIASISKVPVVAGSMFAVLAADADRRVLFSIPASFALALILWLWWSLLEPTSKGA